MCKQKASPSIDRDAFDEKRFCELLNVLTFISRFIPLTTIHLVLDTGGFRLDLATDLNLEGFVALQHVDRNSHTARPAQAQLVRNAGLRPGIGTCTQRTARVNPTLRGLAALVIRRV